MPNPERFALLMIWNVEMGVGPFFIYEAEAAQGLWAVSS
jgi:hypothetical protein